MGVERQSMKKAYLQFSKRCVIAVLAGAFLLSATALIGMIVAGDFTSLGDLMKYYLSFSGIVFIAYCGNSAIEKVAINMTKNNLTKKSEDNDNG